MEEDNAIKRLEERIRRAERALELKVDKEQPEYPPEEEEEEEVVVETRVGTTSSEGYCWGCPLKNGAPCSSSVGSKTAKIAVVGRNPGKQEARTGIPFTGPSGELLNATLQEAGLKREDLYIANAVNCHWPEDEGPPPEAYEACKPRLFQELRDVNPELVLTLGNEATQALLGKIGGIKSLIGSMHELVLKATLQVDPWMTSEVVQKTWVLPTFHPAYILRGAIDGFDDMLDAFKRAKRLTTGETPYPAPLPYDKVHYLNTAEEVYDTLLWLKEEGPQVLAIDTETDFVRDPKRTILLLQVGTGDEAWVFEAKYMLNCPASDIFQDILDDENRTWIFHNAEFDLQYLQHHWKIMPKNIIDTMALALCLSEKLQHCGLKRLVNTYLSVPHYETEIHSYLTHKGVGFSAIPREVLVPYAGFDVIFTYRLYPVLRKLVEAEGNLNLAELLTEAQRLFAEMAYFGIKVDLNYVEELKNEYDPLRDRLEKVMQAYAMARKFDANQVVKNPEWPFLNVRSPKQLLYFVNNFCGLNTDTTDAKFMEKNAGHEFIEMLDRFRKVDHLMKTYVEGIVDDVWPDKRVHPDFVHGTVTGRTTIQHPPLQTLPGDDFAEQMDVKSIRKLFVSEEGYKFVHSDYSQLEIRVAWHITGDEGLGKAVMSKDMHRTMAAAIYHKDPKDITDYERSRSKLVTFGMMYGRQAPSLAVGMKCTVEEAQAFLDAYEAQFPVYFGWWRAQQDSAINDGLLTTTFGRRRRWTLITPEIERAVRNQAVNFPIQSTASDICLSSLIKLNKMLKEKGWGRALFSVHDSVELEIKNEVVEEAAVIVKDIMEHPFEKSCAVFKVKLGYGDNMADASRD